jgi:hypothetical protein
MNTHGKHTGRVAAVLSAVAVVALAGGAGAFARPAGQGFGDPGGDATGGPDVRSAAIGDTAGLLTFRFTVTGMKLDPAADVTAKEFWAGIDTDGNGKSDYFLDVFSDDSGISWDIEDHNEKVIPQTKTMGFFASGNTYTFKAASADLGGATDFQFYVRSTTRDKAGKWTDADLAPDGGAWSYTVTSVRPVIGAPTVSPAVPTAGKALIVTLPVTRSDGAKLAAGATVSVDLVLDGNVIAHTAKLTNGVASLHVTLPAAASGKALTARTSVTFAGHTVTKLSTIRVA